jgi:hypothetical protein
VNITKRNGLSRLAPVKARAAVALASGSTVEATAALVSRSRETVSRWRNHDPSFRGEVERLREAQATEAVAALRGLLPKTVEALDGALADPSRQLHAAAIVLRHVLPSEQRLDVRGGLTVTAARAAAEDEPLSEQEVALATEILARERARLATPETGAKPIDSATLTSREADSTTAAVGS